MYEARTKQKALAKSTYFELNKNNFKKLVNAADRHLSKHGNSRAE